MFARISENENFETKELKKLNVKQHKDFVYAWKNSYFIETDLNILDF